MENPSHEGDGTHETLYHSMTALARQLERELSALSDCAVKMRSLILLTVYGHSDSCDCMVCRTLKEYAALSGK